jgi:hypothetical protein
MAGRGTPGALRRAGRKALSVVAAISMMGIVGIGAVATDTEPASAAAPARNGLTSQTAAPSCWSIKQSYPASTDGIYWLWTPTLVQPNQFYCDMTTDGGGWVLVGRGREGWTFPYWGQGSPSTVRSAVTGVDAFTPATLGTQTIDGLINGARMDSIPGGDGIRLRRATNTAGTTWQEVRLQIRNFGKWSWAWGGGIPLSSVRFDATTTNIAANNSNYQTNTTANVQVQNDTRRITTVPQSNKNFQAGFAYGSNVTNGSTAATSYLWEFSNENSPIPFTQVYLRPKITETDVVNAGVSYAPNGGLAGSTVRKMLDRVPTALPWGVTGINSGTAIPNLGAYVRTITQVGSRVYLGGKFLQVQNGVGGPTFTQSYLAAFDVDTGEWIPSFNPVVNAPVWKLTPSPDGSKLFVGGEFTNINGQANTNGLAALDPITGAVVPSNVWQAYVGKPSGPYDVRSMSIHGDWLYLGGDFTQITGGTGFDTAGPLTLARLARVKVSNGRPDFTWMPTLDTAPQDLFATADRVYMVGSMNVLNGQTLTPNHQAIINTTNGQRVTGIQNWQPTQSNTTEPSNTILEVGDHVYQGGSQHYLHSYDKDTFALERHHATQNAGGDYQAMAYHDGILYAACHCVTDWQFQDGSGWSPPTGYGRVDPINLIGAYDMNDNQEVVPEFHPTQIRLQGSGGEGPWTMYFDSNECMWAGGDLVRQGASANPYYGGFERFCQRDAEAPSVPAAKATVSGNDVTLNWPGSTDNATTPIQYEILKDDPTFGTMVVATTFERTYTESNVVGNARYFVRAMDATGNRSATTSVLSVTPPPPAAATLLDTGATWAYDGSGQDLGTSWKNPSFDTSSWPTGPAEFGWGDGDEATLLPTGVLTQYFVKHVNVSNPSQYKTVSIRLKRDDGAVVYVNGVEVLRDNMPPGAIKATTPANAFVSAADETKFFEYQVPASLFANGDNTIAVELHQPDANNVDGSFDLGLVARNGNETNAPSTPAPAITDVTSSTLGVTWPEATDDVSVIGYLVSRNGTLIDFTRSTSISEAGLTPNTAYTYDVRAVDTSGNVSPTGSASTTTLNNTVLVQSTDVWSYQSGGTPDPQWNQPGYDTDAWPSGPSQLGWGDGDEATVVPNGTLTQYYVRNFDLDDASPYQLLTVRLKRDDGAAVYLNGVEVVRDNLPAGTLLPTTFASGPVNGAAESTWNEFTIPGNLLVSGTNTIAAEVHQDTNNNVDSTFDLELISKTPTELNPPSRPNLHLGDVTGGSVALSWGASTDDSSILGYAVRRNGSLVSYGSATSFTDTGLAPTSQFSYQVTAIDTSGNASTPAGIAVATTRNGGLVNFKDGWNYRFDGVDQGTAWTDPSFDDSSWVGGAGELGIGDADEATIIGPATAPTPVTAYFRKIFEAHDLEGITSVTLDVVRDDGFVAYLNGVEIGRNNMPAGPVAYSTRPLAGIAERPDETTPVTLTVPTSALVAGDNVLAVEMHQFNNSSTDLSFDARLQAVYAAPPVLTLDAPDTGSYVATPTTTFSGLCTTSAGTVTVDVAGNDSALFTAPCIDNEFTVTGALGDGAYSASAMQSATLIGVSNGIDFIVDTSVPEVAITSPTEGSLAAAPNPTISGTCTESAGTVRVALTGTASANFNAPCVSGGTWSATGPILATGGYTASASQRNLAGTTGTSTAVNFSIDATAPTTTDDTATIGNAWRTTGATVHLTPTDTGGAGVGQTYYTTNGDEPTTSSATGTSIDLTADGIYTIKYFSVDAVGNAEPVKTAATQIRIDTQAPNTTDNTSSFVNWTNQNVTVTLSPTDAGQVATTYYTTNGTDPTTASSQGTSISLTTAGTYTIKYFSVDAAGNAEPVKTAATPIRIDKTAPTTTDNTATIGNAWKNTTQTVTLTPVDTGGSGVLTTYYTTNGSVPTTESAQGTSVVLSDSGTYTIRYFSVDAAGNAEAVKTAGTQIRIDTAVPTNAIQFPADGGRYNATTWSAGGCSAGTQRICGTAADLGSGVASTRVSVQRSSNNQWWNGSGWQTAQTSVQASGTSPWAIQLASSQLTNNTTYTVTSWTIDNAGFQSVSSVRTFVYDTSAPTTNPAGLVTTNKNGTVNVQNLPATPGDTFSVTFNEAINPSSVPATGTLTLSRSRNSNTQWGISGLTDGNSTTGSANYLPNPPLFSTYTVSFTGTLVLSNNNQTITFTVTGSCNGSQCPNMTSTTTNGQFQFEPDTDLRDMAGNAPSSSTITAASTVMF